MEVGQWLNTNLEVEGEKRKMTSVRGITADVTKQASLTRPVSYYAFFKGWLLLSQPPGCLGLPTSFPT